MLPPNRVPDRRPRLIAQLSIPLESVDQGKVIYEELKTFVLMWSPDCTINGQLSQMLESCCSKEQKDAILKDHPKIPK